jgi:hypothetical protein
MIRALTISRLLALLVCFLGPSLSLADPVSDHFPSIDQVKADYPDDAQQSAAFSLLSDALNRAAPKPVSRDAYNKIFEYQGTANAILSAHMANGAMQNGQYRAFNAQVDGYLDNTDFRRGVLQKYAVENLTEQPRPAPAGSYTPYVPAQAPAQAQAQAQVQAQAQPQLQAQAAAIAQYLPKPPVTQRPIFEADADVFDQMPKLVFFALGGLPFMYFAAWLVLRRSGVGRKLYPTRPPTPGSLPALPPALQVVKLPNVRYAVYTLSGLVLEVRRQEHRQTITTSTPGTETRELYSGRLVSSTPGTFTSYTTTTQETIIYVRTPEGREDTWSIYDSPFDCRAGNLISVLVRPLKNGAGDVVLAFNHNTGRLEGTRELTTTLSARGNELGQWAANLAGAWAAWEIQKLFLPTYIDGQLNMGFVVPWLFECLVLVTISFLILTPMVKSRIFKKRDAAFRRRYFAAYQQFFEQGTGTLLRAYGVGPGR